MTLRAVDSWQLRLKLAVVDLYWKLKVKLTGISKLKELAKQFALPKGVKGLPSQGAEHKAG